MDYKEIILSKIQDYLKLKKWEFKKAGKALMIKCIYCQDEKLSAQGIYGSHKIQCLNPKCNKKYSLISVVRKIESDKADKVKWTSEKIVHYLKELLKVDVVTSIDEEKAKLIFQRYEEFEWSLVPIVKNGKRPAEKGWTNITHYDVSEWEDWVFKKGLNIGVRTGQVSNITVVDVDQKPIPKEVKELLPENCLIQETKNGFHIFFQYENDLPKTRIDELKIDIENDGGQVVIYPSITDNYKRKFLDNNDIVKMPDKLKELLKSKVGVRNLKTASEKIKDDIYTETYRKPLIADGEGRNDFLIHMAGMLRKDLSKQQTENAVKLLNQTVCNPPLPLREIRAMMGSVERYVQFDEKELAQKILDYIKRVESSGRKELCSAMGEKADNISKALHYLVTEGYLAKRGNQYYAIKKLAWKTELINMGKRIDFKLPYFYDVGNFNWGDMVLIGSKTKFGKTHIAMNIIQKLVKQGITPYYISLETGSRFTDIALQLGLKEGDVKHAFCADPTTIDLEPNAVTIIDWLLIKDKAKTDIVFQHFAEQLAKTNGFIIIFMQLKEHNDEWFAPNMVKQFPALATRYLYTGEESDEDYGTFGEWKIDVVREPKKHRKSFAIPCIYDWVTKQLKRMDEVENEKPKKDEEK